MSDIIDESLPLDTDLAGNGSKDIRDTRAAINAVKAIADAALPKAGGAMTGLLDISASGAGRIKFPATQNPSADANTLDDYEEGTYTPSVYCGGTAANSYRYRFGAYTKIGNMVFFKCVVAIQDKGSGSGDIAITLPFYVTGAIEGDDYALSIARSALVGITTEQIQAYVASYDTARIRIQKVSSGSASSLTEANIDDYSSFRISGFYKL